MDYSILVLALLTFYDHFSVFLVDLFSIPANSSRTHAAAHLPSVHELAPDDIVLDVVDWLDRRSSLRNSLW